MRYEIEATLLKALLPEIVAAEDALARLDERVAHSPVGRGFAERGHYFDAAAALWAAGELVHVEDLVLHDAHMDSHAPSHELTIAHAVLRTRRRLWAGDPGWPLSSSGLSALAGAAETSSDAQDDPASPAAFAGDTGEKDVDDEDLVISAQYAEIDALLARSQKLIDSHFAGGDVDIPQSKSSGRDGDPLGLFADQEWDEATRLSQWRAAIAAADGLPPTLGAALLFDLWQRIEPLRRQHWLGGLLAGAYLRRCGKVGSHLFLYYVGLKSVRLERRRSQDRLVRMSAFLEATSEGARSGMKELDRLNLARTQMEMRLRDRRSNSSLPKLSEFVLSRPLVSAAMVAREIGVTNRGALNLLKEIGLREMTGRGRYRAWGIL